MTNPGRDLDYSVKTTEILPRVSQLNPSQKPTRLLIIDNICIFKVVINPKILHMYNDRTHGLVLGAIDRIRHIYRWPSAMAYTETATRGQWFESSLISPLSHRSGNDGCVYIFVICGSKCARMYNILLKSFLLFI